MLKVWALAVFLNRLLGDGTSADKNINGKKINAITLLKLGMLKNTWGQRTELQSQKPPNILKTYLTSYADRLTSCIRLQISDAKG